MEQKQEYDRFSTLISEQAELRAVSEAQGREIHGLRGDLQMFMQEVRRWFSDTERGRRTNWSGVATVVCAVVAVILSLGAIVQASTMREISEAKASVPLAESRLRAEMELSQAALYHRLKYEIQTESPTPPLPVSSPGY